MESHTSDLIELTTSHGGNVSQEARRLGCRVNQILDASASLAPFPLPRKLRLSLLKELFGHSLRDYPDRSYQDFRDAIGGWHEVDSSMVLPGNGASELFTWAARDAAYIGLTSLPSPGFGDYARALKCWDATFRFEKLPLSWSSHKPQPFPLRPSSDVLWITNPHNPTGQLWSRESIEKLLDNYKLVICDEAFLPLVPGGPRQSLVPLVEKRSNIVVIRSLTKLFALAGLRLGYALGDPERLRRWSQWRDPWPLNGLATNLGTLLMSDKRGLEQWMHRVQKWVDIEGSWLISKLKGLPGIQPYPSSANFFLIRGDFSLVSLRKQLADRRILLRDCRSFEHLGDHWLRIGLQNRAGNLRLLKAMKSLLR